MPIYDVTVAGTQAEIGSTIYDITVAGTQLPLQSVHDVTQAGTQSVIWTAETQIYPGTAVSTSSGTYGSAGGVYGSFGVTMDSDVGNQSSMRRYIAINVTPYNKIRVSGLVHTSYFNPGYGSTAGILLHNTTNIYTYTWTVGSQGSYPRKLVAGVYFPQQQTTAEWDVSGLAGTYYLICGCYTYSAIWSRTTAVVNSVIGIS